MPDRLIDPILYWPLCFVCIWKSYDMNTTSGTLVKQDFQNTYLFRIFFQNILFHTSNYDHLVHPCFVDRDKNHHSNNYYFLHKWKQLRQKIKKMYIYFINSSLLKFNIVSQTRRKAQPLKKCKIMPIAFML